ncbi:MAG: radical SAM protein [Rhodospirillales bacterium]|nr:radical SAM protein [Rhodospirillales bacterium]
MIKSKQSVCLLRPPGVEAFRLSSASLAMPLGLAYLAGSLEAEGIAYSVLDSLALAPTTISRYHKGYLVGLPLEEIPSLIPSDATLVGVGITFTHEWPAAARLIDLIREERPDLPIICGGEHITSMPEFSMATSKADFLVLGEGEETLVELVRAIENGTSFDEIDGIVIRDGNSIIANKRRPRRTDLDNIPWPAWHMFEVETYSKHGFVGGMEVPDITLPLLASRGCPYQCTFCSSPNMWTTRWTARDPKLVVDEIEHYMKTFGARNFPFQDLTAIIKKDWIVSVCNEIIERKLDITWQLPTGTRSEAIDSEVAQLLKRSGQIAMTYAPESGSERTRRYIKKKVNSEQMVASIRDSATADLNVLAHIIHDYRLI